MRTATLAVLLLCAAAPSAARDFDLKKVLDQLEKEVLEGTFTAKVSITTMNGDGNVMTELIEEFHDGSIGIHAITHLPSSSNMYYYEHLETPIFIRYENEAAECDKKTNEEAAKDSSNFLSKYDKLNGRYYLGPTAIVKTIPRKNIFEMFDMKIKHRGIDVDSFVANGTDENTGYQLYFPAAEWRMHVLAQNERPPFPIRIQKFDDSTKSMVIYDFFQVHDLTSTELLQTAPVFQIPFRNGCKLPLPTDPSIGQPFPAARMSFISNLNEDNEGSVNCKEWFDLEERLSRFEESESGAPTVIRDDKHGIKYTIGDTCKSESNEQLDGEIVDEEVCPGLEAVEALVMMNRYFIGQALVRGIPANVWEAIGDDQDVSDVVRLYYSKPTVGVSVNAVAENQIPLRVEIKSKNDPNIQSISLFDYYSTENANEFATNFDVEDCQGTFQYVELGLISREKFDVEIFRAANAIERLTSDTRANILKVADISSLRLPYLKLDIQDDRHIIATAKILKAPDYVTSFKERTNKQYGRPGKTTPEHSTTLEDCAKLCIGGTKGACETILHCENDCFIMPNRSESTWGQTDRRDCTALDKSETIGKFTYKTLKEVVATLEDKVENVPEAFKSTVEWSSTNSSVFHANEFHAHIAQFDDRDNDSPYHLQFPGKSIKPTHNASNPLEDVATVGECYRECIKDTKTSCASFSFCLKADAAKCVLSSVNIYETSKPSPEQVEAIQPDSNSCNIYSVNYLMQFEHVPGKVRKTTSQDSAVVETAADCAARCRQDKKTNLTQCHGFDFCPKRKFCYFYDSHYNYDGETDPLEPSKNCDHYALRFSADYSAVGKYKFKMSGSKVAPTSLDDCAKRCSEQTDNKCKSLAYCDGAPESKTCYMYDVDLTKDPAHDTASHCTLYMRHKDVAEIIRPSRQNGQDDNEITEGMGNGAFAGLLIAMMIVGLIIGSFGFLYRAKVQSIFKRGPPSSAAANTTISYNRQDNDTA